GDAVIGLFRLPHRLARDGGRLLDLAADLADRAGQLFGRRGDRLDVAGRLLGGGGDGAGELLGGLGGLGQRTGSGLEFVGGGGDGVDDAADCLLEGVGEPVHGGGALGGEPLLGGALLGRLAVRRRRLLRGRSAGALGLLVRFPTSL